MIGEHNNSSSGTAAEPAHVRQLIHSLQTQLQQHQTGGIFKSYLWNSCCVSEEGVRVKLFDEYFKNGRFFLDWQRIE